MSTPDQRVHPSVLSNPCETKEQIEYILKLYQISYNWNTENTHFDNIGGSGFCYIYPSKTSGRLKFDANVNFMQNRTDFRTGKRLIEILRDDCKITMTDPTFNISAEWIAIGRLATIVEKLSRQH